MIMWFFRAAEALYALTLRAAGAVDVFGDWGGAHKAHGLDDWIIEDRVNGFFVAVHNLNDAFWQTSFFKQFGQHQRHRWVALGRLQDESVAASNCWGKHPHRDHGWEVERGDARGHTQRLSHGVDVDAWASGVGVFTFEHLWCGDAVFRHFQTTLNVAFGVREGFAVLRRQLLGQLVHVAVQQVDKLHQHAGAALWVHGGPSRLRGLCRGNRCVHLFFAGQWHFGLNLTGGRVHHVGKTA